MNSRLAHAIRATLPSPLVLLCLLGLIGAFGEIVSARATLPSIQINTPNGTIRGGRCRETDVDYFFSIPYAKPPIGDLRFAPPASHVDAYHGILDGRVRAPACPQFGTSFVEKGPEDEDCLLVNVWKPAGATSASGLPVKVWIFGGGNEAGSISDPTYDGCYSATDSVVVSINYRVGPLGFLALPSLGIYGNFGVMDQILALRWVQENIAYFSGDPKKVMLFGQSAGASNAFAIATMKNAPGLIRAAALQSGGGRDYATVSQAEGWHRSFAEQTGCENTDVSCLRSAPVSSLKKAHLKMPSSSVPGASTLLENDGTGPGWGPLVDGGLIPTNPGDAGVRVPSIFGSNTQEGSLPLLSRYGPRITRLNQSTYNEFLRFNFGPFAPVVNRTYSLTKFARTRVPGYAAMTTVLTAYSYRCAAYRGLMGAVRNGVPAWTYSFSHTPSCAWHPMIPNAKPMLRLLGPTHSAELPFVFNLTTHMPPPDGECRLSEQEKELASTMSTLWTNMAATGKPGDEGQWPQWNMRESYGVNINNRLDIGGVDYSMCETFWDHIMDGVKKIAQPTTGFEKQVPDLSEPIAYTILDQKQLHDSDLSGLNFLPPTAEYRNTNFVEDEL